MTNFSEKTQSILESFQRDRGETPTVSEEYNEVKAILKDVVRYKIMNEQIAGPIQMTAPPQERKRNPEKEEMLKRREEALDELERKAKEDPFSDEAKQWDIISRKPGLWDKEGKGITTKIKDAEGELAFTVDNTGNIDIDPEYLKQVLISMTPIGYGGRVARTGMALRRALRGAAIDLGLEFPRIDALLGKPPKREGAFGDPMVNEENILSKGVKKLGELIALAGRKVDLPKPPNADDFDDYADYMEAMQKYNDDIASAAAKAGKPVPPRSGPRPATTPSLPGSPPVSSRLGIPQDTDKLASTGETIIPFAKFAKNVLVKGPQAIPPVKRILTEPGKFPPQIRRMWGADIPYRESKSPLRDIVRAGVRTGVAAEAVPLLTAKGSELLGMEPTKVDPLGYIMGSEPFMSTYEKWDRGDITAKEASKRAFQRAVDAFAIPTAAGFLGKKTIESLAGSSERATEAERERRKREIEAELAGMIK